MMRSRRKLTTFPTKVQQSRAFDTYIHASTCAHAITNAPARTTPGTVLTEDEDGIGKLSAMENRKQNQVGPQTPAPTPPEARGVHAPMRHRAPGERSLRAGAESKLGACPSDTRTERPRAPEWHQISLYFTYAFLSHCCAPAGRFAAALERTASAVVLLVFVGAFFGLAGLWTTPTLLGFNRAPIPEDRPTGRGRVGRKSSTTSTKYSVRLTLPRDSCRRAGFHGMIRCLPRTSRPVAQRHDRA